MNGFTTNKPLPVEAYAPLADGRRVTSSDSGVAHLVPDRPPGRSTRKARKFANDIRHLYAAGYTLEAIRQALAAIGVTVSRSTVHREVLRARRPDAPMDNLPRGVARTPPAATAATPPPHREEDRTGPSRFAAGTRGEAVAEAFMATQITNPFLRDKEQR